MARYIDAELLMQKLSRMIDYVEKNKDKKFNALGVLFQVGDALMDCPTADVVPKSEVEKIFEEIEKLTYRYINDADYSGGDMIYDIVELRKKYTEDK